MPQKKKAYQSPFLYSLKGTANQSRYRRIFQNLIEKQQNKLEERIFQNLLRTETILYIALVYPYIHILPKVLKVLSLKKFQI